MIIDTISIIVCIAIVVIAVLSILANPFLRKVKNAGAGIDNVGDNGSLLPKLTVIVLANNNAKALDDHLPIILTQDYAPGFEVVVVGEKGDLQTEAVIKQYSQNKHLYATYIPSRSLFMSKTKLAVALGVKAAHNEWIVLVNSNCRPQSDLWLANMACHMDDAANLVIGYSNYNQESKAYYRFCRLRNMCYLLRQAIRGIAYRTDGTNIAFRRSEFIERDGFRGNLQLVNGEYDFIVNKYARQYGTRIAVNEDAWVREDEPTSKVWHDRNIYYANVRQYLQRSFALRSLFNFDMSMMYIGYCLMVICIICAAIMSKWIVMAVAALGLIATIIVRSLAAKRMYAYFGEDIPAWKTVFFEISLPWHALMTKIRYSRADKYDFTTHKL